MDIDLYLVAITPGIALALGIYLTDRYDREPLHLLIKIFVFGGISILPVILVEKIFAYLNIFTGLLQIIYDAFIVAGFTEEYFKRIIVMKYAYDHKAFNEKLDGIVYAVFTSLGFATVENILYVVFRYSDIRTVGIQRAIFSVPAHMLFAITMGYYLSLAKYAKDQRERNYYLKISLLMPVLLHGLYDYILMSRSSNLFIVFIPFVVFLWGYNLRKLNRYYRESKEYHTTKEKDKPLN